MFKEFILNFLYLFSNAFLILLFARIILSFLPTGIMRLRLFIFNATEPVLAPLRKVIPPIGGVLDLSPLIVYFAIEILITLVSKFM